MKDFYEKHRDDSDTMVINRSGHHVFPAHFHRTPEILLVKKGGYRLTLEGVEYEVREGDVAVIDSFVLHSYDSILNENTVCDDCVIIFPYKYLSGLKSFDGRHRITNPIIHNESLVTDLLDLTDKLLGRGGSIADKTAALFIAMLNEQLEYSDAGSRGESNLMRRVLSYIQENFRGDVSRKRISSVLGYSPEHISRVFHTYLGKGLSEYVNELRLAYIDSLIGDGDTRSITELIYDAGFGSQQTYYRERKKRKS